MLLVLTVEIQQNMSGKTPMLDLGLKFKDIMKFHLWRQMSEKLLLHLDSCFLLYTVAPKIYCLTEKTGLQDSLSVKTEKGVSKI